MPTFPRSPVFGSGSGFIGLPSGYSYSATPTNLTSPLSAAIYLENQELIRNAAFILCQSFSGIEGDSKHVDDIVVSGIKDLARAFNIGEKAEHPGKTRTLRDLYSASRNLGNDKEARELRTFATTLQDGYILCQYLNKRRSKRLTSPTPSRNHFSPLNNDALDDCLDNLQQFISACVTCGIADDDLFEFEDLLVASNESLARVATTIIALSGINKKRHNSAGTEPGSEDLVAATDQVSSLRQRTRRLKLDEQPHQARSQDDTKRPVNVAGPLTPSNTVPCAQPHPFQIAITLFSAILQDKETHRRFLDLQSELAQMSLDTLQWMIDSGKLTKQQRAMFVTALLRLSIKSSLYPSCLVLKDVEREPFACANGGFGDVYKGKFRDRPVCIKIVRVYKNSQVDRAIKAYSREAILWSQAKHSNVLPFYGVYQLDEMYRRVCLVSPWMENGNIREYLAAHPRANRHLLARDVARGLRYLHDRNIIHGDLKGPNILVTRSGQACLGDFGLACISDPAVLQWTSVESSAHAGGTVRWKAPELVDPDKDTGATKESDVYAFGCVCYEIFTSMVPFHETAHDYSVILLIMKGKTPSKPPEGSEAFTCWGLDENIWSLLKECWSSDPSRRPTVRSASQRLPRPLLRSSKKGQDEDEFMTRSQFRNAMMENREVEAPSALIHALTRICTGQPALV